MKLKKVLISIYIFILILYLIGLIVLSILGSKERVGYLDSLSFIEVNNNNYVYNFRINYYDKIFRSSDIYGVYLVKDSLPDYIKKYINNIGERFGKLISCKRISTDKIDNIKYTLRIKISIFLLFILLIFLFFVFLYISDDLCILIINSFNISNFIFILKKYIIPIISFIFIFFILFNISVNVIFIFFVLLVLILFIKKSKSLSNIRGYHIISVFVIFLILPSIIYSLFGNYFDKTNYENRLKAEKPILSINNLYEYTSKYEEYFNDYVAFRNELVKLKNYIDIFIFKNIISDTVLLGKNKSLFYRAVNTIEKFIGIKKYYFSDIQLEIMKNNLVNFRDELKKRDIDFVLMICPDKSFIYTEYMPSYIKRRIEDSPTDILVEYLKNNTDIKIIYPKNELLKYKEKYELYSKYDHHWNYIGGYIGYTKILEALSINYHSIDSSDIEFINVRSYSWYNSLAGILGLKNIDYYNDFTDLAVKYEYNKIYTNIFVKGDSFFSAIDYYINNDFSNVVFTEYGSTELFNDNVDIFIFEIVEWRVANSFLNILPNYREIIINEDLETNADTDDN